MTGVVSSFFIFLICPLVSSRADDVPSVDASTAPTKTLADCLQIGLDNYESLRLADEEVELARLKRQEAYRAFYPALTFKAESTSGKTEDVNASPDFDERIYGAGLTQSLLEGGRISATYRQAVASHEAAEKSREKTYQDFVYGVNEAYWKLVAAQSGLAERERTRDRIKNDLKIMTEQYVLDLAVKQQFLSVKGQYLQASNQASAARIAYSKARWGLAKALGIPRPPDFDVRTEIPFQKIEPLLDDCLSLAAGHRPDLIMQERLVDMAAQAEHIAGAANRPKVTLNAFYGRSASAYTADPLVYRQDWQVDARLSQPFFGNTLALDSSKINTSPRLGQSTRTNTQTNSMNINFLDGMKDRTEIKQADLSYRQAKLKRDDLRKDVAIDVEEAFYNVSQAAMQVEFTDEDGKLAEEELRVADSKGKYGLSSALELAQARNRVATARGARIDALAGYQISLAALNRAIGITDKFKVE